MKSNNPLSTENGAASSTQDKGNKPPIINCIFSRDSKPGKGNACIKADSKDRGCVEGTLNWLPYGVPPCYEEKEGGIT